MLKLILAALLLFPSLLPQNPTMRTFRGSRATGKQLPAVAGRLKNIGPQSRVAR